MVGEDEQIYSTPLGTTIERFRCHARAAWVALQRRDVELLPNLARLLTDELVPLARRTGLRVRTDARAPPLTPGLARALAAIAAMRVPGAFELPRRGDSVLVLQGCFAAVVEVSMPPVPKIRRGVSPSPLPLAAATE